MSRLIQRDEVHHIGRFGLDSFENALKETKRQAQYNIQHFKLSTYLEGSTTAAWTLLCAIVACRLLNIFRQLTSLKQIVKFLNACSIYQSNKLYLFVVSKFHCKDFICLLGSFSVLGPIILGFFVFPNFGDHFHSFIWRNIAIRGNIF